MLRICLLIYALYSVYCSILKHMESILWKHISFRGVWQSQSSPWITSCLLISWGLRPARTSGRTRCCQFGGSHSESVPWSSSLWISAAPSPSSLQWYNKVSFSPRFLDQYKKVQMIWYSCLLIAFGVPSWVLQKMTEKSVIKIRTFKGNSVTADVTLKAPVTFFVILWHLVQVI